jgi:hypothetical protein
MMVGCGWPHVERGEIELGFLPDLPRIVVVAVDDRYIAQQAPGALEERIGLRRHERRERRGDRNQCECGQ